LGISYPSPPIQRWTNGDKLAWGTGLAPLGGVVLLPFVCLFAYLSSFFESQILERKNMAWLGGFSGAVYMSLWQTELLADSFLLDVASVLIAVTLYSIYLNIRSGKRRESTN
jgi:hypothetical protein